MEKLKAQAVQYGFGEAAAPTAGLHFTPEMLEEIKNKGVNIGYVTLHVGLGTFRPVKVDDVNEHHMHTEFYQVPNDSNYKMNPPLRTEEDRQALIEGLKDGTFEVISTDHAPHARQEKGPDMKSAAFGIVGLETSVLINN